MKKTYFREAFLRYDFLSNRSGTAIKTNCSIRQRAKSSRLWNVRVAASLVLSRISFFSLSGRGVDGGSAASKPLLAASESEAEVQKKKE